MPQRSKVLQGKQIVYIIWDFVNKSYVQSRDGKAPNLNTLELFGRLSSNLITTSDSYWPGPRLGFSGCLCAFENPST